MHAPMAIPNTHEPARGRADRISLQAAVALFGVAAFLAGYLAWVALKGGSLAGCGVESSCSRVLQSQWAYWLGIPVSVPALGAYLLLGYSAFCHLFSRSRKLQTWTTSLAIVVVAAAVWFVILQGLVIRAFCFICLTAHLSAVMGAVLLIRNARRSSRSEVRTSPKWVYFLASLTALAVLIGGQFLRTRPTNRVSPMPPPSVAESPASRTLSLYDGLFQLDLNKVPRLGPADAQHVIVYLFDYTCHHCRSLHGMLDDARQRSRGQLAVIMLPVPLDSSCNALVRMTASENRNACQYARLALAVWETVPDAFPGFNSELFEADHPPSISEARQRAEHLIGISATNDVSAGASGKSQLSINFAIFQTNGKRAGSMQLPQLMVGKNLSVGKFNNLQNLLALLREQLGISFDP